MLYQVYEAQRTLMEPFVDFAQAAAKLYSNPLSPLGQNPFAQRVAAGYSLIYRLGKDYEKPAFDIKTIDVNGTDVTIHERVEKVGTQGIELLRWLATRAAVPGRVRTVHTNYHIPISNTAAGIMALAAI